MRYERTYLSLYDNTILSFSGLLVVPPLERRGEVLVPLEAGCLGLSLGDPFGIEGREEGGVVDDSVAGVGDVVAVVVSVVDEVAVGDVDVLVDTVGGEAVEVFEGLDIVTGVGEVEVWWLGSLFGVVLMSLLVLFTFVGEFSESLEGG